MFILVGTGVAELRIKSLLQNLQLLAATLVPLLFMIPILTVNKNNWIDVSALQTFLIKLSSGQI